MKTLTPRKPLREVASHPLATGWLVLGLLLAGPLLADDRSAVTTEGAQADIRELLHDFMGGASAGCPTMHDRFWHPDLVYTSSNGTRFGKAELMAGVTQALADESGGPGYRAEDVDIRILGETAVLTFRLVAETPASGDQPASVEEYFNTGVLVQHEGKWKTIAWQATRRPFEDADAAE